MNRRNFLKALGLGGTTGTLAACGIDTNRYYTPVEEILPYVVRPEQTTPGSNTMFATTILSGHHAYPLLAAHRDGRVTMVEGNALAPVDRAVSSPDFFELQRHYSPDRIRSPERGAGGSRESISWDVALETAASALVASKAAGKKTAYLGPCRSGTIVDLIEHVAPEHSLFWEADGRAGEAKAAEALYGHKSLPAYDLASAHYLVSFGADVLSSFSGSWGESEYAQARAGTDGVITRFAYVGPHRGLTGANADDWIDCQPGSEAGLAMAMAHLVARATHYDGPANAWLNGVDVDAACSAAGIERSVLEAASARFAQGKSLAVPSSDLDPNAVAIAMATFVLNEVSGNKAPLFHLDGYTAPMNDRADLMELVGAMEAGEIGVLFLDDGVDPVHALGGASKRFVEALEKVDAVVSLSSHGSETHHLAPLVLPTSSPFEDWGDEEPKRGMWYVRQPVQTALNDTRALGDILLALARASGIEGTPDGTWRDHLVARWRTHFWPQQAFWDEVGGYSAEVPAARVAAWMAATSRVQLDDATTALGGGDPVDPDGVAEETDLAFRRWWTEVLRTGFFLSPETLHDVPTAPMRVIGSAPAGDVGEGLSLVAFAHAMVGTGRYANQPWAQEVPDPMTGITWGTWAEMNQSTADSLGLETNDQVEVSSDNGTIVVGVEISPTVADGVVAIPMGGGHTLATGRYANGIGDNVMALIGDSGAQNLSLKKTDKVAEHVHTFGADHDQDRNFAVNVDADDYAKVLDAPAHHPGELTGIHHLPMDPRLRERDITGFYPLPDHPTYRFGMTVDTNLCNGCGACSVACYAENNLPIVGPQKVREGREMGWIRINRFFKPGEGEHDDVHFVPMMCQQCGHAPCESVCPVLATYHNIDGLNAMIYNRCVGTRYCSNACPYSVRKFNYHTYVWPQPFNLQLNPDVATRTMGVMEKCTFCIQRIRRVKSAYRDMGVRENGNYNKTVPYEVWEQMPVCASACPSQAMTFGNLLADEAKVTKDRKSARAYTPLAELNTYPAINYLAKASYHKAPLAHGGHGGDHGAQGDGHGDDHGAHGDGHGEDHGAHGDDGAHAKPLNVHGNEAGGHAHDAHAKEKPHPVAADAAGHH